jgi:hypothetical protein
MRQATLPLIVEEIEEDSVYGLQLAAQAFYSARWFPLDQACWNIVYKTSAK